MVLPQSTLTPALTRVRDGARHTRTMTTGPLAPSRATLYLQLIRWDRPAGWLLLLWPTLSALWIAADGFPGWHLLVVFMLGTVLMRSAGCCANDVADREFDRMSNAPRSAR